MSIDKKTLLSEREILKKDFDSLTTKIAQVEKDLGNMKSNLNAVFGAIQQVDKLIALEGQSDTMSEEKERALNLATG